MSLRCGSRRSGRQSSKRPPSKSSSLVKAAASASEGSAAALAQVEVRLQNACSVKVLTSILGIELGSSLAAAYEKLDKLSDPSFPPKEENDEGDKDRGEGERKVLWRFGETDYSALFVKSDDEERITSITALVRPAKAPRFENIGKLAKAPIRSDSEVAWDVIRPNRPLFRVVARGADKKADTITICRKARSACRRSSIINEENAGRMAPDV